MSLKSQIFPQRNSNGCKAKGGIVPESNHSGSCPQLDPGASGSNRREACSVG